MANRANGPMIRHQQWSTFNRNMNYQQRRSREISQISQNNIRRNQTDQRRLEQSHTYVRYDGQIVYSENDLSSADFFSLLLAIFGGSCTISNLVMMCIHYRLEPHSKNYPIAFKIINRLSLIFYIPLILLNAGRILDFTLSLRQRLVEVLHPKDGAGDGQKD